MLWKAMDLLGCDMIDAMTGRYSVRLETRDAYEIWPATTAIS